MEKIDLIMFSILYFFIVLLLIFYLIKKRNNMKNTPMYNGLIFSMMFYYLIVPMLVLINVEDLNALEQKAGMYCSYTFNRFILNGNWGTFIYSIFIIIITIIVFNISYSISAEKNILRKYKFRKNDINIIVKNIMYFTFFVGIISLIIFFASFGGIGNALSYAEKMRNMSNSLVEEIGSAALLKIIARLITVTPFLAIFLINKSTQKNTIYEVIFIISLIGSILFYLYNAGRTPIILFILCFVYYILCKKVKKPWTLIITLGIIVLPVLDVLDSLFVYFNTGSFDIKQTNYTYYLYQLSVPYKNTLILNDVNEAFGLRWWTDIYKAFLDLLPGINYDAAYVNLSEFVRGSDWRNLGGIPTDFITFAHMQLSFLGVIMFSAFSGYISQIIDYKLSLFDDKNIKSLFVGILTLYSFFILTSADFASIIKGQFILIFIIFIILKSSKKEM